MPHESTVAHEQRFVMETPMISRSRTFKLIDEEEEHSRPTSVSIYKNIIFHARIKRLVNINQSRREFCAICTLEMYNLEIQ